MGTRPSIGCFTLKVPVGRSMEASSGRFEIKAPVGRLMAASSGRYLTGAPIGRHHKSSSGRSCQVAPIGRCHQVSNGRFNLKAPTGRFHGASNGCFQGEAANGHAADSHSGWVQVVGLTLAEIILPRLSSPSSFHLVRTGLKPPIGRFRDASWTLRLDGTHIRPGRGQPPDGSHTTKIWTTNGRPKNDHSVTVLAMRMYFVRLIGGTIVSDELITPFNRWGDLRGPSAGRTGRFDAHPTRTTNRR
ncbi:hypothetical protein PCASD_24896 [Puccinia coronata f. sp. avenae]|uniref:Uncharacterized protein n=1 Tax=Puccinia coronata f. sp. avenae TaxID=200324 RepID=A0A2N5SAP1_9BASI|nr:hypothetical protein PCASD_24896 [Puccinia coronata f. sp. avenae]